MSQLTIRQGIQTTLRALATFASADVTLSDITILDEPGALSNAPFAVILPAALVESAAGIGEGLTAWDVPVLVYTGFDSTNKTWAQALEEHAAIEEAVINGLWADPVPTTETHITAIRTTQEILEDVISEVVSFIFRPLIVTVQEI